jgi:glycosyltransferase involved in cell wall biosynthesis
MGALNNTKKINSFCVLVCAHNEAEHIEAVVRTALEQTPCQVVVIDDGSTDGTAELAEQAGAYVLRNPINLGKGASLKRGFELVRERNCDAIVVVDGDGQHDPREIHRFLDAYKRTGIPILIGNRMANTTGMPFARKWTNRFMCRVLNRLTKLYVADPPCGFRFYRTDVLPFITSEEQRFAFEFDVLIHAALRHIRVDSVRISTIYHENRHSQVAPLRDAWLLLRTVLDHYPLSKNKPHLEDL